MSILTLHLGDNVDVVIWSMIEEHSAVICACLPSIRPLLVQWIPGIFKSLTKNNTGGSGSYKMSPWQRRNESYSGLGNSNAGTERYREDSTSNIVTPTEKASHGVVIVDEEIGDSDWQRDHIKKETRVVIDSSKIQQEDSWAQTPRLASQRNLPGIAM
jgi:hypothetical protein